jgi:hypothetical protein
MTEKASADYETAMVPVTSVGGSNDHSSSQE